MCRIYAELVRGAETANVDGACYLLTSKTIEHTHFESKSISIFRDAQQICIFFPFTRFLPLLFRRLRAESSVFGSCARSTRDCSAHLSVTTVRKINFWLAFICNCSAFSPFERKCLLLNTLTTITIRRRAVREKNRSIFCERGRF